MKILALCIFVFAITTSAFGNGLVACWPQDGNGNDIVGGHDPSATNAVSFINGKIGQGVTLGAGGYIDIPDSPTLQNQQFTVTAWVRPDGPGPNNDLHGSTVIGKGLSPPAGNNARSVTVWWSAQDNRFRLGVSSDPNTVASANTFPAGQFYHIAGTYDGSKLRLYINGQMEAELSTAVTIPYDSSIPWTIGTSSSYYRSIGFARTFNGVIDDVKLHDQALSSQEVQNSYLGLLAWWPEDGHLNDIIGGHNPSANNAISFVPGRIGSGVTLANGGYIDIPDSPILHNQHFTVTAWVRPDGSGPNNDTSGSTFFQKGLPPPAGNFNLSLGFWWSALDNRFRFGIGLVEPVTNQIASAQTFTAGNFYHVAGTYDGVRLKLYVNGQLQADAPRSITVPYDPSVPWTIGSTQPFYRSFGFPRTFNGVIDEVKLYNRALNANEIFDAAELDIDADGITDALDNCPNIPNADQTDTDFDGQGDACDADIDGDNVANGNDNCPLQTNVEQTDSDGDGAGNVCDSDDDNDGVLDVNDNCALLANIDQIDTDADSSGNVCDGDDDNDVVLDVQDNCMLDSNPDQNDLDEDGIGDACESDTDGDGVDNTADNCLLVSNADQLDSDGDASGNACDNDDDNDGIPDVSDNCPLSSNADQSDTDGDDQGDTCDSDDDNDSIPDNGDNCPLDANLNQADNDGDGNGDVCDADDDNDNVFDGNDNCPFTANSDQADSDGDGEGNACDGDIDGDGALNASDNCPQIPNADQMDIDDDGLGDVCDGDIDGDGMLNENESCPSSDLTPVVMIGYCNSGVLNHLLASGCTITDLISNCAEGAANHGDFVSCVSQLLQNLKNQGVITAKLKGAIKIAPHKLIFRKQGFWKDGHSFGWPSSFATRSTKSQRVNTNYNKEATMKILTVFVLILAVAGSAMAGKPGPQPQGLFLTQEIADSDVNAVAYSIQSDGTGVYKDGLNGGLGGDVSVLMSNVCNGLIYGDRLLDLQVRQVRITLTSTNALKPGDYLYQVPAQSLGTVLNSVRMMNKLTCPDNKSMLAMTAGSKIFSEMHLRLSPMDTTTNYYRLDMGVADEVETQKVQILCNSADSTGCNDWSIDPISDPDYTENPGMTRARLNYIVTKGRGSVTNRGAFYMTFHIHATRP